MEEKDLVEKLDKELFEMERLMVLHGYSKDPNKTIMEHVKKSRKLITLFRLKQQVSEMETSLTEEEKSSSTPPWKCTYPPSSLSSEKFR